MNARTEALVTLVEFTTEQLVELLAAANNDLAKQHPETQRIIQIRYILHDILKSRKNVS